MVHRSCQTLKSDIGLLFSSQEMIVLWMLHGVDAHREEPHKWLLLSAMC